MKNCFNFQGKSMSCIWPKLPLIRSLCLKVRSDHVLYISSSFSGFSSSVRWAYQLWATATCYLRPTWAGSSPSPASPSASSSTACPSPSSTTSSPTTTPSSRPTSTLPSPGPVGRCSLPGGQQRSWLSAARMPFSPGWPACSEPAVCDFFLSLSCVWSGSQGQQTASLWRAWTGNEPVTLRPVYH